VIWGCRGTTCWQFIGDINRYVRHGPLIVEGTVGKVTEAGVLVAVGVRDIFFKKEEEVSEGLSRYSASKN